MRYLNILAVFLIPGVIVAPSHRLAPPLSCRGTRDFAQTSCLGDPGDPRLVVADRAPGAGNPLGKTVVELIRAFLPS